MKIVPSILTEDFGDFLLRLRQADPLTDVLQIDPMDRRKWLIVRDGRVLLESQRQMSLAKFLLREKNNVTLQASSTPDTAISYGSLISGHP